MNRSVKGRKTNERRRTVERRFADERRRIDAGAPERRLAEERRQLDLGPPERRLRHDRRDRELGPPSGWKDRRRWAERRCPEVLECSFEEWVRLRAVRLSGDSEPEAAEIDHEKLGKVIIRD